MELYRSQLRLSRPRETQRHNREKSCHPPDSTPDSRMCRMSAWYYNMFIILMSVFMGMGGILLTALAYRPKQITEDWWEWTNRFYESGQL